MHYYLHRDDYLEMFAPRCGGCGRPILDNYISALNRHWHPECFVCRVSIDDQAKGNNSCNRSCKNIIEILWTLLIYNKKCDMLRISLFL